MAVAANLPVGYLKAKTAPFLPSLRRQPAEAVWLDELLTQGLGIEGYHDEQHAGNHAVGLVHLAALKRSKAAIGRLK